MHDLIQRHVVRDPYIDGYWMQVARANSVAEDGVVIKWRDGPLSAIAPEDCELQIIDGVVQNPFVTRISCGAER